ncbi:MAG: phosphoribosylglycinamide formyltransferase [Candidatus Heimdallarchaeum aukensis]|uniref:phosphoribosylglycinamide formyltransferase 1 n=1 Tax=Candidatus Heimdallarchaeum aukensis TaxID=2876573 RepID=A0A9Y1BNR0_9ARCH|nr:MAG: phosphoribosylglycinamide formyltransferase [Candidatus Heimdallarchaeum aukensis]
MNVAVLISGRGSNLEAILEKEKQKELGNAVVSLVVSNIPDAKGLEIAKRYGKKTIVLPPHRNQNRETYDKQLAETLEKNNIDLVVLAGFMRILSPFFVNKFSNKIINIHPSLLPSFPGINAQKQALDYGAKITGCTVHFVDEKVDHGPIILQEVVLVDDSDTEETLAKKILEKEHILLPKAIRLFSEGKLIVEGRKVRIVN